MKELLKQISVADYQEFRKQVMSTCGWSNMQFWTRSNGKTKLKEAERIVIQGIIDKDYK